MKEVSEMKKAVGSKLFNIALAHSKNPFSRKKILRMSRKAYDGRKIRGRRSIIEAVELIIEISKKIRKIKIERELRRYTVGRHFSCKYVDKKINLAKLHLKMTRMMK